MIKRISGKVEFSVKPRRGHEKVVLAQCEIFGCAQSLNVHCFRWPFLLHQTVYDFNIKVSDEPQDVERAEQKQATAKNTCSFGGHRILSALCRTFPKK